MAGTYINMQDAFAIEKNEIGNWAEIGYTAPGAKNNPSSFQSKNFTFTGTVGTAGAEWASAWTAVPNNKLNDCTTAMKWNLAAQYMGNGTNNEGSVKYTATSDAECAELTTSFKDFTNNLD